MWGPKTRFQTGRFLRSWEPPYLKVSRRLPYLGGVAGARAKRSVASLGGPVCILFCKSTAVRIFKLHVLLVQFRRACAHACVRARTRTRTQAHPHVLTHALTHPSIHPYMHPPSHPCTCGLLCVHIPVRAWAYASMHLCICLCVVIGGVIVRIYLIRRDPIQGGLGAGGT